MLNIIKGKYRDSITEILMEEEEDDKTNSASAGSKHKNGGSTKNGKRKPKLAAEPATAEKQEDDLATYLPDKWETIRDMEYYKHFFDTDLLADVQVLPAAAVAPAEKKKKRKKKAKKSVAPLPVAIVMAPSVEKVKTDEEAKELVKEAGAAENDDSPEISTKKPETELEPEEGKSSKDETASKDPVTTAGEGSRKNSLQDPPNEDCKESFDSVPPTSLSPGGSHTPALNAENLEKLQSVPLASAAPVSLPESVPPACESHQKSSPAAPSAKKPKKKTAKTKAITAAKKEYEELKARALLMFSAATATPNRTKSGAAATAPTPPGKQKAKKPKKKVGSQPTALSSPSQLQKSEPAEPLLPPPIQLETQPEPSVTPSTVSSFTPKRSQTPTKQIKSGGAFVRPPMSPLSDKVETTSAAAAAIPKTGEEELHRPRRGRRLETRKKLGWGGPWKAKDIVYRKKDRGVGNFDPPAAAEAVADPGPYQPPLTEEVYCDPFYINPEHEKLVGRLNTEIASMIHALETYNSTLFPVCKIVRNMIEQHAAKVFALDSSSQPENLIQAILYGSVATGLALEDSDVDITLNGVVAETNDQYMDNLVKLGDSLKTLPFVEGCKVITTARVPVIKLVRFWELNREHKKW